MATLDSRADRAIDLLDVGEVNPDVVVADGDPRPAFGQAERMVDAIRLTIGSSSVITACGAARLGLRVAMVGVVGDDPLGSFMIEAMRSRGIDVDAVVVDSYHPTGASVILSDGRDRAILTGRGTIGAVTAAHVPDALVARARHVHLGSWFLQDALRADAEALLVRTRAAGLTSSVDPNWDPHERWDDGLLALLPELDLLFPHEVEACRIADNDDVEAAALELARRGAGLMVVVKRGPDGALVASADGVIARVMGYPVTAVDTTGAGDSFDAGFLAAWLGGATPAEALRAAAVAGALSTLAIGGVDGQPTAEELGAALRAWPA
jgi:sugar/nucleoside kinase (ribokinase family)